MVTGHASIHLLRFARGRRCRGDRAREVADRRRVTTPTTHWHTARGPLWILPLHGLDFGVAASTSSFHLVHPRYLPHRSAAHACSCTRIEVDGQEHPVKNRVDRYVSAQGVPCSVANNNTAWGRRRARQGRGGIHCALGQWRAKLGV